LLTDGGGTWSWASTGPSPVSGAADLQAPDVGGARQAFIYNAASGLGVAAGDTLYAYVDLNASTPSSEVMLQWNDGSTFEQRAYWGSDSIPWGTDGTASRQYMGTLPAAGEQSHAATARAT
jgi:hypothetical protein